MLGLFKKKNTAPKAETMELLAEIDKKCEDLKARIKKTIDSIDEELDRRYKCSLDELSDKDRTEDITAEDVKMADSISENIKECDKEIKNYKSTKGKVQDILDNIYDAAEEKEIISEDSCETEESDEDPTPEDIPDMSDILGSATEIDYGPIEPNSLNALDFTKFYYVKVTTDPANIIYMAIPINVPRDIVINKITTVMTPEESLTKLLKKTGYKNPRPDGNTISNLFSAKDQKLLNMFLNNSSMQEFKDILKGKDLGKDGNNIVTYKFGKSIIHYIEDTPLSLILDTQMSFSVSNNSRYKAVKYITKDFIVPQIEKTDANTYGCKLIRGNNETDIFDATFGFDGKKCIITMVKIEKDETKSNK
jgi:hypothetical protein